jgi:hypothetical protein
MLLKARLSLFPPESLPNSHSFYPFPQRQRSVPNKKKYYKSWGDETLFQVSWREGLNNTRTLTEPRPEDPVCVLEHAILQTDDDEL